MSRRKIANLERDLEIAESDYRDQLIAALQRTADGYYGFFSTNAHFLEAAGRTAAVALLEAGKRIQDIRAKLGITDKFDLHERYLALRQVCREPNGEGEPKVAARFLSEIEATS